MRKILLLCSLLCASPFASAADGVRLGLGVESSSGTYGTGSSTRILSTPVTAAYSRGAWSLRASLPWLRVEGDANVVPGIGTVSNLNPLGRGRNGLPLIGKPDSAPATQTQRGTASGLGDLRIATSYTFPAGERGGIGLTASAKLATADADKGLGTGANDYGVSLDAYRSVGASTTLFGGIGYTHLGESRYIEVDAAANANAGVSRGTGRGRIGVQVDWREAVTAATEARRDATGFYSRPIGERSEMQVYASKGMSDGSPDWNAGLGFTVGF